MKLTLQALFILTLVWGQQVCAGSKNKSKDYKFSYVVKNEKKLTKKMPQLKNKQERILTAKKVKSPVIIAKYNHRELATINVMNVQNPSNKIVTATLED